MSRMKKPAYSETAVGWTEDDFEAGVTTYGVAHYEGEKKRPVPTQVRMRPPLALAETDMSQ